jgi:formylglycine-generating enzyme required for sulfatase activity
MRAPLAFLKFVAKAALNYVGFGVAGDLAVEVLPDVARDVWEWWGKGTPAVQLRDEVQAVGQLSEPEALRLAAQAVTEEAKQQPPQQRDQVAVWLAQVPAAVRATQRRPADPSGRTVSAAFPLEKPADLLPLLPARLPRFSKGDRPGGLGGDWTLEELLGTGGFGEVWKAVHPSLPPWAVKFCLDASAKRSLQNEATLLGRVIREGTHPGIVRLMHTSLSSEPPLLAYEFVGGGELTALVRDWHLAPPANHVEMAAKLMHQLAGIVAFAHRLKPAIVHRDLKPANVLLERKDKGVILRVADFGIGGVAAERGSGHTLATMLSGSHTPLYASPQQKKGERPDPRDDVHALGVIWLHLLTGDLALEPGYWRDALHGRDVPQPMLDVLQSCLALRAEQRLPSAIELESRLAAVLAKPKPPAPPLVLQPPPPPQPRLPLVEAPSPGVSNPKVAKAIQAMLERPWAHAHAQQLQAQHKYADAVRVLEGVPQQLRDAELYATLVSQRDEVAGLERRVEEALDAGKFVGLSLVVERLLKLMPNNDDMRQLLATLPPLPGTLENSIGMKFVLVPPGKFLMGSPPDEADRDANEDQHEVEITRPFYVSVFQTTQAQFQHVLSSNPSFFRGSNLPVEQVTWHEAVEFCNRLTRHDTGRSFEGLYCLPTEAEWEYACRGGANSSNKPFHFRQPTSSLSSAQANFDGNLPYGSGARGADRGRTTEVGSFEPNAIGLYDVHGNVWEWCQDWYAGNYYKLSPRHEPRGPQHGECRVLRGGSWYLDGHYCRAACRDWNDPDVRDCNYGFRVVFCLG